MLSATCLALVMFFEAGIEPPEGRIATGWVVVNSARTLRRKPVSICWEATRSGRYVGVVKNYRGTLPTGHTWSVVLHEAKSILAGKTKDPTGGAIAFECTKWKTCKASPWWAEDLELVGMFGSQKFWRKYAD